VFTDADAAALYDLVNPWDGHRFPSDAFYDGLVISAESVLDIGCGTGSMLHAARARGHRGRLVGLDPDDAALDRARQRTDIEWVLGTAAQARWNREFELATMVSHAFQCLVDDDEVHASLVAIRTSLRDGGRFVFETRHPQARAWAAWTKQSKIVDAIGRALLVTNHVESVVGDVVTLTSTKSDEQGNTLRTDHSRYRFLDVPRLNAFLTEAGLGVEAQYGDWRRGPITDSSSEIVTIARRP
jgi:SAM-dependent methyltransferase